MTSASRVIRFVRFSLLTPYYLHPAVAIVTLRRGPRAAAIYMKEMYRASKLNAGAYLPVMNVEDIEGKATEFKVFRPENAYCSMTLSEISTLCCLLAARRPKKILEIGSFRGLTTLNLAL